MDTVFGFLKKSHGFWPQLKWQDVAVLATGLSIFLGLALQTITKFSIWFDEAFGSYLIRFNYAELTRYTALDVHPPLYYWLLKTWALIFGNTEIGIRSMSVFFGAVTIILAFLFVLRFFGRKAAYISLIFLVLSPMFLRYSQEARMYTLLTTTVTAATYVLVYAQENAKKRWPWIVYGLLLAVGMLTQYFAALAWMAHWVWRFTVVRSRHSARKQLIKNFFTREWVIAHVIGVGLFLPWLPFMVIQFTTVQTSGFWIPPFTSDTLTNFMAEFILFGSHATQQSWIALGLYACVIGIGWLAIRLVMTLRNEHREHYLLLVCMVFVPIIILILLSMPPLQPAFINRYLMAVIVFLPLLIGVGLALSSGFTRHGALGALGGLIAILMMCGVSTQMEVGNYNKSSRQSNNARQLIDAVHAKTTPGTPILSNTPWVFYETIMYSTGDSPIYFINETTDYRFGSLTMLNENDMFKVKDVDAFTDQNQTFWVITNLREASMKPLRDSWREQDSIVINDSLSAKPLLKATRFTVE